MWKWKISLLEEVQMIHAFPQWFDHGQGIFPGQKENRRWIALLQVKYVFIVDFLNSRPICQSYYRRLGPRTSGKALDRGPDRTWSLFIMTNRILVTESRDPDVWRDTAFWPYFGLLGLLLKIATFNFLNILLRKIY